jgi:hypothetical protein
VAWGDEDEETLYMTALIGLYRIRLNIAAFARNRHIASRWTCACSLEGVSDPMRPYSFRAFIPGKLVKGVFWLELAEMGKVMVLRTK